MPYDEILIQTDSGTNLLRVMNQPYRGVTVAIYWHEWITKTLPSWQGLMEINFGMGVRYLEKHQSRVDDFRSSWSMRLLVYMMDRIDYVTMPVRQQDADIKKLMDRVNSLEQKISGSRSSSRRRAATQELLTTET